MNSWGSVCVDTTLTASPTVLLRRTRTPCISVMGKDRSDSILVLRKVLWGLQLTRRPRAPPQVWLTICLWFCVSEVEMGLVLHWGRGLQGTLGLFVYACMLRIP